MLKFIRNALSPALPAHGSKVNEVRSGLVHRSDGTVVGIERGVVLVEWPRGGVTSVEPRNLTQIL